jgi:hypothetical protein
MYGRTTTHFSRFFVGRKDGSTIQEQEKFLKSAPALFERAFLREKPCTFNGFPGVFVQMCCHSMKHFLKKHFTSTFLYMCVEEPQQEV